MTGGKDKEGHVVTFKTWIRNTNADFLFLCKSGIRDRVEKWEAGARTKGKKTTNSKISSSQLRTCALNLFVYTEKKKQLLALSILFLSDSKYWMLLLISDAGMQIFLRSLSAAQTQKYQRSCKSHDENPDHHIMKLKVGKALFFVPLLNMVYGEEMNNYIEI